MKIIITEDQRDRVFEKAVFKYLGKRNYKQLEINDYIYFVENEDDEYAVIRYDKDDGWCFISYELVSFLSRLISTEMSVITDIVGKWVEDTLQMKVSNTKRPPAHQSILWLKIPYK
jgi:hypothetical protein